MARIILGTRYGIIQAAANEYPTVPGDGKHGDIITRELVTGHDCLNVHSKLVAERCVYQH